MSFEYTDQHLITIRDQPHILGHIAEKNLLTEMHSEWIKYIWDTNVSRSLQAHRGSFKTTGIIIIGAVRWLLFHPNDRIAIIRKTWTMAAQVVNAIRKVFELPEIQELFRYAHGFYPKFRVKQNGRLEFNFKTTATPEANIEAHGLDASLTGTHYDKIISDDFVTLKDRLSKAEREKTKEIVREIATNIIDKGKACSWVGTPWHKSDSWGILPKPERFSVYDCGILTEEEIEEKRKITLPSLFAANYELKHMDDENSLFKDPQWDKWRLNYVGRVTAQLDAAFSGDHTNALTIFAKRKDGAIQGAGFAYPGNVKDWINTVAKYCERYRVSVLYNETNPDKGYTADALRRNPIIRRRGTIIKTYAESSNKHNKIASHLYEQWSNIYWDVDSDMEYMEQIVDYQEGQEPDDAPDSAASLLKIEYNKPTTNSALWEAN